MQHLSDHRETPVPALRVLSAAEVEQRRASIHNQIRRAYMRRASAQTDAQFEDADSTVTRLSLELADLAAAPVGRLPSQEV